MQKLLVLMITALIVSLDSFVAGFSMSLNKKQNAALPATVALVTFLLCSLTTLIGNALKDVLGAYVNVLSAAILTTLAVFNLLKTDDEATGIQPLSYGECAAIGVAVGMDACVANLSLAIDGYGLIAPLLFGITHYFTVFLGQKLAGKISMPHSNVLSAAVLFILAVMKFI